MSVALSGSGREICPRSQHPPGLGTGLRRVRLSEPDADALTLLRFEGRARYVDRRTGLGGYVQSPVVYASNSRIGHGLVLHAGITLPTGATGGEAEVVTLASAAALPGFYNALPRGTTVKLGVSPTLRSGIVFARLDLGFDGNIDASQASGSGGRSVLREVLRGGSRGRPAQTEGMAASAPSVCFASQHGERPAREEPRSVVCGQPAPKPVTIGRKSHAEARGATEMT